LNFCIKVCSKIPARCVGALYAIPYVSSPSGIARGASGNSRPRGAGLGGINTLLACLHDQTKVALLEGRLFSSQSELFENFSNGSDCWIKAGPPKKTLFYLIM